MDLNVADGTELIVKAFEKRAEDRAWQLYLTKYPNMTAENFMPFEEFYNPKKVHVEEEQKSAEEILSGVKEMMDSYEWG